MDLNFLEIRELVELVNGNGIGLGWGSGFGRGCGDGPGNGDGTGNAFCGGQDFLADRTAGYGDGCGLCFGECVSGCGQGDGYGKGDGSGDIDTCGNGYGCGPEWEIDYDDEESGATAFTTTGWRLP